MELGADSSVYPRADLAALASSPGGAMAKVPWFSLLPWLSGHRHN